MAPVAAAGDTRSGYLKRLWLGFCLALIPGMRHWNTMCNVAADGRYGEIYYVNGHDKPHAGQYQLHMDYINKVVPKDRLCFHNVKDGWEPLCKILGRPIPDVPFPHTNDGQATAKVAEKVLRKGVHR